MAAIQEQQLFQSRPTVLTPVQVFSPGADQTIVIKNITITNLSNNNRKYSIYIDDDGTTYDESTAIAFEINIGAKQAVTWTSFMAMNNVAGNIAVQTDTINDLTFTGFGAVIT